MLVSVVGAVLPSVLPAGSRAKDHGRIIGRFSRARMPGRMFPRFRSCFPFCQWFVSVPLLFLDGAFCAGRSLSVVSSVRGADRVQPGRRVTKQKSVFNPAGPSVVPFVLIPVSRCPALPGGPGVPVVPSVRFVIVGRFAGLAFSIVYHVNYLLSIIVYTDIAMSNIVIPLFFHVRFLLSIIYCLILPWYNLDITIYSLVNLLLLDIYCYNLPC